jgi:DtxR family transcriptional regulator, Mn-dependent transcriptional regulator
MPARAVEEYLRAIQALDDDGVEVIQARIAERLGNKAPTVSQMVDRLTAHGYVRRSGRLIYLTDLGRQVAAEVIRKHRLANRLLVDVLGIPDELAREEAHRWEHVMSDDVASRIATLLAAEPAATAATSHLVVFRHPGSAVTQASPLTGRGQGGGHEEATQEGETEADAGDSRVVADR